MRILVCGGRDYQDKARVWAVLDELCGSKEELPPIPVVIIHGGAQGADALADSWAVHNWVAVEEYLAQWDKHGRAAGPIRNQLMLDQGKPDLVIAFPGGRGTADMVRRAKAAGVLVKQIT